MRDTVGLCMSLLLSLGRPVARSLSLSLEWVERTFTIDTQATSGLHAPLALSNCSSLVARKKRDSKREKVNATCGS